MTGTHIHKCDVCGKKPPTRRVTRLFKNLRGKASMLVCDDCLGLIESGGIPGWGAIATAKIGGSDAQKS